MAVETLIEAFKQIDAEQEKRGRENIFQEVDRRALAKMSDKALALWQSQHPSDSPQYILSQFEWNRRLTAEQTKWARWSVIVGFIGVIIGALLQHWLEK
ncbi:MAG TPA: hypothetical protein VFY06_05655 [Verrucomicrobiae bacterium]|nr:hypothetical protein [Verrucomicrobiae bacterium]